MEDSESFANQIYEIQESYLFELIGSALSIGLDDEDVSSWVIPRIENTTERVKDETIERLMSNFNVVLSETKDGFDYIQSEVEEFWGFYMDWFLYLIRQYYEIGSLCNKLLMSHKVDFDKHLYAVNTRIHALSCRVANEVYILLSRGFSDGALSHVRTMYEYEIVSRAIWESPAPKLTAKKYDDHRYCDEVRKYKVLEKMNKLSLFDIAQYESAVEKVSALKKEYGKSYELPWGWANHLIRGRPSFGALDKAVSGSSGADLYYWSSSQLHASSIGLNGVVGPSENGWTLVSGPTDILSCDSFGVCLHALDVVTSNFSIMLKEYEEFDSIHLGINIWLNAVSEMSNEIYEKIVEQSSRFIGAVNGLMDEMENTSFVE